MKHYIINAPQLQSVQKRLSALFAWAICWVMWIYLLTPLVTLCSWILGDKKMINQMRWFGGYKSLLELMQIYGFTLLVMIALWLAWIFFKLLRKHSIRTQSYKIVSDLDLCTFYQINTDDLNQCRNANLITVFFNDQGRITELEPQINKRGF
jgi:poly-beta-1,6-N-acetyl-D-glucosamine biosynthesis protein PgaD